MLRRCGDERRSLLEKENAELRQRLEELEKLGRSSTSRSSHGPTPRLTGAVALIRKRSEGDAQDDAASKSRAPRTSP
jgi:hypothetical protein